VGESNSGGTVLSVELCRGFLLETALSSPTEDNTTLGSGSKCRFGGSSLAVGMARSGEEGFNIRFGREACLHVGLDKVLSCRKGWDDSFYFKISY
jgi:hypothetical protein